MKRTRQTNNPRLRTKLTRRITIAVSIVVLVTGVSLFISLNFSPSKKVYGAANGDYRTKTTGNWSSASTWEKYNGTSWVNASASPTSADGVINILSGNTVTVTSNVTIDQTVIDVGGAVVINSTKYLYEANGTGVDLTVNGTLTINNGGYLSQNSSSKVEVNGSVTLSNGGFAQIGTSATFTINSGGTFTNNGGSLPTSAGKWVVSSGATYQHSIDGDTIPYATWGTSSTCNITGVTVNEPGGLDQTFENLTWNCTAQTTTSTLNNLVTINGNLSILSTGTGQFRFAAGTNTVGGDFSVSGGTIRLAGGSTRTVTVGGDFSMSGGTIEMANSSSVGTINVAGNYSHTAGTIQETGTNTTSGIVFNKSGTQTFTSGGTVSNQVNFTVNSGSILDMGTSTATGAGNFTVNNGGGLMMGSTAGITSSGATGNVQVTGTRSFSTSANYTYNGSAAQVSGNGLPATVNNLILNNSNDLTLTNTVSVSGILDIASGKIITGSKELRVTNTSTSSVTGHSSSNYVVGNLRRSVSATGSYDYPVGTSSNYELINITLSGITGFTNILGKFTNANPIEISLPLTGLSISGTSVLDMLDYGYWTLTPNTSITGGTYSVTLNEKGQTNAGALATSHCVLKRAGLASAWQSTGTHSNSTQSISGGVVSATRSALNSFSDFGIGKGGGAFPIELIYFNAKLRGGAVDLKWATASELNNDHFDVERSGDGRNFDQLKTQPGAGNSSTTIYYSDLDENPLEGYSYYRLKQTDYDGHFSYSDIKTIIYKSKGANDDALKIITTSPNPFSERFTVTFMLKKSVPVDFQLINSSGSIVYNDHFTTNDGMNQYEFIDQGGLQKGIYFMCLLYNDQKQVQRIVKN